MMSALPVLLALPVLSALSALVVSSLAMQVAHAVQAAAAGAAAPAMQAPPAQPGEAASLTLETLLKAIGGRPVHQARFVEKKYLAVLDAPVESAGVLRYQAPDRLEKNTEHPIKESMMLDGDLLVVQRDGRRRSLPAAQFPGVAALVGGLRDTLGGDADALRRMFKVVVQGDAGNWQMDLLPSDTGPAELVNRITLRGRDDRLLEVETLQADGDRSVMTLLP